MPGLIFVGAAHFFLAPFDSFTIISCLKPPRSVALYRWRPASQTIRSSQTRAELKACDPILAHRLRLCVQCLI